MHHTLFIPRKGQHTERTIYTVGWLLLFSAPPLMQLYDLLAGVDSSYEWGKVGLIWLTMLYYFICFELNDMVLLPKLLAEGKRLWYLLSVVACTASLPSSVTVAGETLPLGDSYKKALQQYIKDKRL